MAQGEANEVAGQGDLADAKRPLLPAGALVQQGQNLALHKTADGLFQLQQGLTAGAGRAPGAGLIGLAARGAP